MYFYSFAIISPWRVTIPFIWTNLNFLHSRIMCTKIDWIWAAGSGEQDFKKVSIFLLFRYYLPLERDNPLHLNKLEFPSSKDDLCQVWLKLACWFWRFLKIFSVFLHFCDYLPLEKGNPLHFNNLESPPPKNDLCQVWLKLAQRFWRRSRKCKSLQTDGRTDDGRSE